MATTQRERLVVLCTCPDAESGRELAGRLVSDGLAACVNLLPGITSVYRWQGEVQHDSEVLLLAKTTGDRYAALESALAAAHPYELPEIVAVPIERGLEGYLAWLDAGGSD